MNYDLELEKAVKTIKRENAKIVCIQLPDGLKPMAKVITDTIRTKTDAQVLIWGGSAFGACDLALEAERVGVDLLFHWGHTAWRN